MNYIDEYHLRLIDQQSVDGRAYEENVANFLRDRGWSARLTKCSGDNGVDIVAEREKIRLIFQCKYYQEPVGIAAVQEALCGKMVEDGTHAFVVTNSVYTKSAIAAATKCGVRLLRTMDLAEVLELACHRPLRELERRIAAIPDPPRQLEQPRLEQPRYPRYYPPSLNIRVFGRRVTKPIAKGTPSL